MKPTVLSEIDFYNPDKFAVVRRGSRSVRLFGPRVTDWILKHFDVPLPIAYSTRPLGIEENLSSGVLDHLQSSSKSDASNALDRTWKKPVDFFAIKSGLQLTKVEVRPGLSIVKFLLEQNQNAIKNLTKYVHLNHLNLMFLGPNKEGRSGENQYLRAAIKRINTSVLMVCRSGSLI